MKKIAYILIVALTCVSSMLKAETHRKCDGDWKRKMASEKIAFLTLELDLTQEEAQLFWPVYNEVEKAKDEAFGKVIAAYRSLSAAIEEGKSAKETDNALEAYLDAQAALREVENQAPEKLKAALPAEKVARLYVAEEKFRRQHIRRLNSRGEGKPSGKPAPQR